jgi:DnaJ family protein B protein 4
MTDYYKLLEINRDASEDTIKKAYKKLALKWHPDRNQNKKEEAERRFKEISEAYEVLSDKDKRAIYDQFGEEGLKSGGGPTGPEFSGFGSNGEARFPGGTYFNFMGGRGGKSKSFRPSNAEDIFRQFFSGGADPFAEFDDDDDFGPKFSSSRRPSSRANFGTSGPFSGGGFGIEPAIYPLKLTLEELFTGCTKKIKVTRRVVDQASRQMVPSEKILSVQVKPGWKAGTKLNYAGEGDEYPDGHRQDIQLIIEEKPHPIFRRDKDDLHVTINLTLEESLCGFTKTLTSLDGKELKVANKAVTVPNQELKFSNGGMPNQKNISIKGALIVTFKVTFPPSLTEEQKVLIHRALGPHFSNN